MLCVKICYYERIKTVNTICILHPFNRLIFKNAVFFGTIDSFADEK